MKYVQNDSSLMLALSASVMLTIPEGEKGQYQIVNMQGQVVMQGSVTQTGTELKTSGLPKGIYTLKFTGKQFNSQKLVIE